MLYQASYGYCVGGAVPAFQSHIPTIGPALGYSFVLTREDSMAWVTIPYVEVKVASNVKCETGLSINDLPYCCVSILSS